jgi:hypothetical protein
MAHASRSDAGAAWRMLRAATPVRHGACFVQRRRCGMARPSRSDAGAAWLMLRAATPGDMAHASRNDAGAAWRMLRAAMPVRHGACFVQRRRCGMTRPDMGTFLAGHIGADAHVSVDDIVANSPHKCLVAI